MWCNSCKTERKEQDFYTRGVKKVRPCKQCLGKYFKQWKEKNAAKIRARRKEIHREIKITVLSHYSPGRIQCACCHDDHLEFMTLDHTDGGGAQHRQKLGMRGGSSFYRWIIRNGFPEGYRVLCANCNTALGLFGYCPHILR